MHLATASLLGLALSASATPSRKPWQISHLSTFAPSGRPGSSPWSVANITISDPNDATVSPAICWTKWTYEESPYDIINACSDVPGGRWTFVMLEAEETPELSTSPLTYFKLQFNLTREQGSFTGTETFVIGENLSGLCSASGICSFGLKEEKNPYPVHQTRIQ